MDKQQVKTEERGFVLVTALLLIMILTILGVTSSYKTVVEAKISKVSGDLAKVKEMTKTGLNYTYGTWDSTPQDNTNPAYLDLQNHYDLMKDPAATNTYSYTNTFMPDGTTANPLKNVYAQNAFIFVPAAGAVAQKQLIAESVGGLDAAANNINASYATIDDLIVAQNSKVRVYEYTYTGSIPTGLALVANNTWDTAASKEKAQVAIWIASYKQPSTSTDYPYGTQADACPGDGCSAVIYSLARQGEARMLAREYMTKDDQTVQAFGAMTNAPKYTNATNWCTDAPSPDTGSMAPATDLTGTGMKTTTHFIDATQAPGGLAIASNNSVNAAGGNKPWGSNLGSGSQFQNVDMYVTYDPGKVSMVDYPKVLGGQMSAIAATVVSADRAASDYIDYFADADSQLFQLDAYREGANYISGFSNETFSYVDGAGVTQTYTTNTGGTKLGNAATLSTNNANHGRTGTLQWADAYYNIINAVPMYGLVRMMVPAKVSLATDVNGNGMYDAGDVKQFMGACSTVPVYTLGVGSGSEVVDPLGNGNGKVIVYGAGLFDFFWDKDNDGIYEPHLAVPWDERVLTPKEALSLAVNDKVNVDIPLMFNPVMDGLAMNTLEARGVGHADYAGAELLEIGSYPTESPSWDLTSDELLAGDGSMDLIYDVWSLGRSYATLVHDGAAYITPGGGQNFKNWMLVKPVWPFTAWGTAWSNAEKTKLHSLLDYYIRTTALASKNTWSQTTLASIQSNYSTFSIDTSNDLKASNSAADLFHVFLPSGYIHGWKRAMQVTGLAAQSGAGNNKTIWSEELIGANSRFYGTRHKYFNITRIEAIGKAYIDKGFADMPAQMYAGGLVDQHQEVNISGVVYTPGMLELEQKNQVYADAASFAGGQTGTSRNALQYINGLVITGHGVFMKAEGTAAAKTVIAYDDTSIDNLPVQKAKVAMGRRYLQELK